MKEKMNSSVKLRVAEASQDDAYKGIARIDTETMKALGLRRGDVILIKGGRETVAIVDKAYPADIGEGIIRIDGIIRRNAKTGVGESVIVQPIEVKEAKKVTIAPLQENVVVHGDPEVFRNGLLGRAVIKGDIVVLGGVQRRRDLMSDEFGDIEDIFGGLLNGFGVGAIPFGRLQETKFVIVNTSPSS
ncbi:MAG: ATPase, partial [Candidatus Pacearchaeota archaeon]